MDYFQKYKKAAISIAILTLMMTAGLSSAYAATDSQGFTPNSFKTDTQINLLNTLEAGDYEQWKQAVGHYSGLSGVIAKDDFLEFIRARKFAREGRYDESLAMSQALGDRLAAKLVDYLKTDKRRPNSQTWDKVLGALQAGDFQALETILANTK